MDNPFFYIVVTLGVLTVIGIICIAISPLLKDKEQQQT
jgi:hypothetical protein